MNNCILSYIIQQDMKMLRKRRFQMEEFAVANPTEIQVSNREIVYIHYVNVSDNRVELAFISDDNHHLYLNQNMRRIDNAQFESGFIHKHLSNIQIESGSDFLVQYIKIRF